MESTKSETDQSEKGKTVPETEQSLPSSRDAIRNVFEHPASSGTYSCTASDCHARFDDAVKLQKHRREAHRPSLQYASTPTTPNPPYGIQRQLDRTMSDVYQDEMYSPALTQPARLLQHHQQVQANIISPSKTRFSDLLQAANSDHLTARSASPAVDVPHQWSPFQERSQFAMEDAYSNPTSFADVTGVITAARSEQQQLAYSKSMRMLGNVRIPHTHPNLYYDHMAHGPYMLT